VAVYAYLRASIDHNLDAEIGAVGAYCADRQLDPPAIFADAADTAGKPLLERPRGKLLSLRLQPSDVVVLASLSRSFCNLDDIYRTVAWWRRRRVRVHVLGVAHFDESAFLSALEIAVRTLHEQRSERARQAQIKTKRAGRRWTYRPPLGFKWARGQGKAVRGSPELIVDEPMMAALRQFVLWHQDGYSYTAIWRKLLQEKIRRPDTGREWTLAAIQRGVKAYERYQACLQQPASDAKLNPTADNTI
jgi:DNA invertase Pin-like site-specific DNA recombinase